MVVFTLSYFMNAFKLVISGGLCSQYPPPLVCETTTMEGTISTVSSHNRHASRGRASVSLKDVQRIPQETVCDPWPVTKFGCRKDTVLEAAQVLVRARNTELLNICCKIILLPASGGVPGVQGGSLDRPLYSLRPPGMEPFKIHMWQIPEVRTWNKTTWSWRVTPGKIMVRRGQKSEPLAQLLKTIGVAKGEAKTSDLCDHFRCWRFFNITGERLNEFPRHLHGAVYERWWSFNGFRFLDLPPELREIVLTFAMGPIAIPFTRRLHPKRHSHSTMQDMRLCLVNKQLNREVVAALLAHTTFYFHSLKQFIHFCWHREEVSGGASRAFIGLRCLELDLSPDGLLRLFGIRFGPDIFIPAGTRYDPSLALDLGMFFDDEIPLCDKIRINIPHVFQHNPRPDDTCCQKVHNLAFWAGARARLRNIAVVELVGHIDEMQKKEFLAEHTRERKGTIPEAKDFAAWQRRIWAQCSESVCECSPKCNTWRL